MPFVNKTGAFKLLREIENGKCKGECRSIWLRNIKYALKTKTNPLNLTATEKQLMKKQIDNISGKRSTKSGQKKAKTTQAKTQKKYTNRKSPPYPANEYCNKKRKGNDGLMYISRPNKNNVCSWKKV